MTVNKQRYSWDYFLGRILILLLFAIPIINSLAAVITNLVFNEDYSYLAFLVWAYSLLGYSWTMLLFVLAPYSLIYIYTSIMRKYLLLQWILFYVLLTLSGFLIKDASIIGAYLTNQYPRAWLLYFLLTITIVLYVIFY